MPGIRVKEGESFESALRRFKKKCEKAGILSDLRRHQHFEKPSERRKRKMNAAKRKNLAPSCFRLHASVGGAAPVDSAWLSGIGQFRSWLRIDLSSTVHSKRGKR